MLKKSRFKGVGTMIYYYDDISSYLERRLEEWANWYSCYGDLGLGYPHKSIEGKLIDNGGILIKRTQPHDFASNTDAEEIENFVTELAKQNPSLAIVLREEYFSSGITHQKARRVNLSYSHFRTQLDKAKQWMLGRLSASYRQK